MQETDETMNGSSIARIIVIPRDSDNLALCAIVTFFMQITFYLVACTCKVDTVTDFAGASNFVILAILTFGLSGTYNARQIMLTVLVTVWGVRLGSYLLIRILKISKDERFNQIIWVFMVSLPVIFVNSPITPQVSFGPADYVGAVLFATGLIVETIADTHKFLFRNNPTNKGKWMDRGLWKISRHPNYLGEIVLWWGAFILSVKILQGAKWTAVISPVFVSVTLIFGSGIPLLERNSDRKYGQNPDYQKYKNSTPPILPGIPPLYHVTPYFLKLLFCCEFPFYTVRAKSQDKGAGSARESDKLKPADTEKNQPLNR